MISLLATVTFMFSSCDNDDSSDTTKPLIELHEPEEGQALEIGNEHGVHFEMDLSDDVMLNPIRLKFIVISTTIHTEVIAGLHRKQ